MKTLKVRPPIRGVDSFGSGAYLASRGNRKHRGIDFSAMPGSLVEALAEGVVTKLGYAYPDDLSFRYVEVTDSNMVKVRYFYISPLVAVGNNIVIGDVIGKVQDLGTRYPGITPHVHFGVKDEQGNSLNPEEYLR